MTRATSLPGRAVTWLLPLLLSACSLHPPAPRYPVGLGGPSDPAELRVARAAGFDFIASSADRVSLDAAAVAGLAVLASPAAAADPDGMARAVREFGAHPAVRGWWVTTAAGGQRHSPARLAQWVRENRRTGAGKPVAVVLRSGWEADQYTALADLVIVGAELVPGEPLAAFARDLRLARFAAGSLRPCLASIPVPREVPPAGAVLPGPVQRSWSRTELRALTWLALLEGANGVLYLDPEAAPREFFREAGTGAVLRELVAEIRDFEPLFLGRVRWRDFDVRYPGTRPIRNEALDPAIQAARVTVDRGSARLPAGDYLVAVNTTARTLDWAFQPAPGVPRVISVMNEGRELLSEGGWFTDRFEACAVRVYGPLRPVSEGGGRGRTAR